MTLPRRHFLQILAAALSLFYAGFLMQHAMADESALKFGPAREFSFEALKARAKTMATQTYIAPARPAPEIVQAIDYDAHGALQFKPELAPFGDIEGAHPVTFFHIGRFFPKKIIMNIVDDGKAREILYEPDYFSMPASSPAHKLEHDGGLAGFRFHARQTQEDWLKTNWVAYLGSSYFRAISELGKYGLSARGIAVNTAVPDKKEEFPDFREFWIETPQANAAHDVVYALLDGPSIAGAYKFTLSADRGVVIDVEAHLYVRKTIDQLGIAPMSSMYWFSETRKPYLVDWRPEVHDTDGLEIVTGAGERIWRPLNNPLRVVTSSFDDNNPHGFGLMQRDRDFDHYLDGVSYEKRPSLWIEPLESWGKGAVQLIEIPTDSEIHDNIVAMWVPIEPAEAGREFGFRYKMHWQAQEPYPANVARVVATRLGQGGRYGVDFPNKARKFLIEFEGPLLKTLAKDIIPEQVITVSRGEITLSGISEPVPDYPSERWRTQFDLKVTGDDPVELRCYLKNGDQILTETWLYQYHPKP
jgi:glucans biosynthesis protein